MIVAVIAVAVLKMIIVEMTMMMMMDSHYWIAKDRLPAISIYRN